MKKHRSRTKPNEVLFRMYYKCNYSLLVKIVKKKMKKHRSRMKPN